MPRDRLTFTGCLTRTHSQRPEVRERRRLRDRERNKTPERKAYMRERDRRRRAAKKLENK